jgi:hypothetical protein
MTAQVPIGRTWTLYPILGDLFAWCCVVVLVVTLGALVLRPSIARPMLAQQQHVETEVVK